MNKSKGQRRLFLLPYGERVIDLPLSTEEIAEINNLQDAYPKEYEGTEGVLKANLS